MAKISVGESESIEERKFYAAITIPRLHKNSFALGTAMLKSNLFRVGTGPRMVFKDYTRLNATGGWKLEYKGEELRLDDQRVLLALIKLRSGQVASNVITLVPRTFCRCAEILNWADSGDSTTKLRNTIKRLYDARVRLTNADGEEHLYSFVSEAILEMGTWQVWLSNSVVGMFERRVTYLDVDRRLGMKDGLLAWMYGYIKADACLTPIDLRSLRLLAGSTYEQKDFNKELRKVLKKLLEAKVIREYVISKAGLNIKKVFKTS